MEHPRVAMVVVVAALAAAVLVPAELASAHGDDAVIELVGIDSTDDPSTSRITVDVRFEGDDHAVYSGSVQLAGRSSTGVSLLPVQFSATDVDGRYVADAPVAQDGVWELRILSREPEAQLTIEYDPADPGRAAVGTDDAHGSVVGIQIVAVLVGCGAVALISSWSRRRRRSVPASGLPGQPPGGR